MSQGISMELTWSKVDNVKFKHSEKNLYPTAIYRLKPHELTRDWNRVSAERGNKTFRGPCIVVRVYSYNESQRDALFLKFIW